LNLFNFSPGSKSADFTIEINEPIDTAWAVISFVTNSGKELIKRYSNKQQMKIPPAPKLIYPAKDTEELGVSINFKWSRSKFDSIYTIQVSTDIDFGTFVLNQNNIKETIFGKSGLSINTDYYWRVKAANYLGESQWSETWSFKTYSLDVKLLSPSNNGIVQTLSNIKLKWTKPQHTRFFSLQLSDDNEFVNKIINRAT